MRISDLKSIIVPAKAVLLVSLALGLPSTTTTKAQESLKKSQRPVRFDDMYNSEEIDEVAFAPDGRSVAYVKLRPMNTLPPEAQSPLGLLPREDIWLQEAAGQPARNLTNGKEDASKWWDVKWSPDGQRFAFLSTRGGNVTLWIWERRTNKIRQASPQDVSLGVNRGTFVRYCWVGKERILFLTPPEGAQVPPDHPDKLTVSMATEVWEKARRGDVTASVVNSTEFNYPTYSLYLLDVVSGKGRRIAATLQRHLFYPDWWPSPDGRFLALVSPVPSSYNMASNIKMGWPHNVELRTMDGEPIKLDKSLPENIHTQTIKWSPDGKELAFFANGPGPFNSILLYGVAAAEVMPEEEKKAPMENPAKLYRVNIEKKTIERVGTGEIDLGPLGTPDFIWTATGELIFNAPKRKYGQTSGHPPGRGAQWGWSSADARPVKPQSPKEWLVLDRSGNTRLLSRNLPRIEGRLWSINGGVELLGLADGEIYSVTANGEVRNLTERFAPRVASIFRTDKRPRDPALIRPNQFPPSVSKIVMVKAEAAAADSYHVLDLKTGEMTQLVRPAANAGLTAFSQESGSAAYSARDASGLYLWRADAAGKADQLVEANTYLREIATAEKRIFGYRSLNGQMLKASVTLPLGYKKGPKYPVYVDVYPNSIEGGMVGAVSKVSPAISENFNAAAGYAILRPSAPVNLPGMSGNPNEMGGEEGDSCLMATNGVLPAVEKLVDIGIADPDRVFIYGMSAGGWMVQCTVTQTTRFRAAVAEASATKEARTDALRGGIWRRYSENPAQTVGTTSLTRQIFPSEMPWWRDGDRSRRSNPMSYVDRVQTPLMLIHGDLDVIPFDTSEDFFNALVSMRKPARFVRYWGEGHGLTMLGNIRDHDMRILAWFDQWGDIARDALGNMIWDGDRVKGRNGAPPLKLEDYAKFDLFQPSPARQKAFVANKHEQK